MYSDLVTVFKCSKLRPTSKLAFLEQNDNSCDKNMGCRTTRIRFFIPSSQGKLILCFVEGTTSDRVLKKDKYAFIESDSKLRVTF